MRRPLEKALSLAALLLLALVDAALEAVALRSRLLHDARAAHVMAPPTDLLKTAIGRILLDLPVI